MYGLVGCSVISQGCHRVPKVVSPGKTNGGIHFDRASREPFPWLSVALASCFQWQSLPYSYRSMQCKELTEAPINPPPVEPLVGITGYWPTAKIAKSTINQVSQQAQLDASIIPAINHYDSLSALSWLT